MALTIETGAGVPGADSYQSVADILAYLQKFDPEGYTAFNALASNTQEVAARNGAAFIDDRYRNRWKGQRSHENQGLAWPRAGVMDFDGFCLDANVLPPNLLKAHAEATLRASEADLQPDVGVERGIVRERKKLDVLEKEVEYAGSKPTAIRYTKIDRLLADLIASGDTVERG